MLFERTRVVLDDKVTSSDPGWANFFVEGPLELSKNYLRASKVILKNQDHYNPYQKKSFFLFLRGMILV